jgi:hypothetical protein
MKYLKPGLAFTVAMALTLAVWAQNFYQQGISFTLVDTAGASITQEALANGQIRVYSLREAKVAKDQQLTYNPENKRFTFTESVMSPGISLALISPSDTMFLSVFGRSRPDRVIDSLRIQKGSYLLTSNEFAGKYLKVADWNTYLEDEVPADKQDLSSYIFQLKDKKPVTLVQGSTN